MKKELQNQLFEKHSKLFVDGTIVEQRGIECDDGWYQLIDNTLAGISVICPEASVEQIKQKFGGLRCYTTGNLELLDWFRDGMGALSFHICEVCGQYGKLRNVGGVQTLCDKHFKEAKKKK